MEARTSSTYSRVAAGLALCLAIFLTSVSGWAGDMDHKIGLNTATAKELEVLPGIGQDLAQRIVEYRKENGPFKAVDDLEQVKGIGKSRLAKVKDLLKIDSPPKPAGRS